MITVAEVKEHCNVDFDTLDSQFQDWIDAAIPALENFTGVAFDGEAWQKQAVKMYVSDLYENRGESKQGETAFAQGRADVGEQAKQYCKSFINHGFWF